MNDRGAWAEDLRRIADEIMPVSAHDLRANEDLHDSVCDTIRRFEVPRDIEDRLVDQMQYPPQWGNLKDAVENASPELLLINVWGWIAEGRWYEAPLAAAHETGWLIPALRKLADNAETMHIQPQTVF